MRLSGVASAGSSPAGSWPAWFPAGSHTPARARASAPASRRCAPPPTALAATPTQWRLPSASRSRRGSGSAGPPSLRCGSHNRRPSRLPPAGSVGPAPSAEAAWHLPLPSSGPTGPARPETGRACPPARTVFGLSAACLRHTQPSLRPPFFSALGRLAIQTAGTGLGFSSGLAPHRLPQRGVDPLQGAIAGPIAEVAVDGAFGREVARQVVPSAAGTALIEDRVQDLPPVLLAGRSSAISLPALGQQRLDPLPFGVGQVRRIRSRAAG